MMTRSEILGLLTELVIEEVSLDGLKSGQEAIKAYREILEQGLADEEGLDEIIPDLIDQYYAKQEDLLQAEERKVHLANLKEKEGLVENLRSLIQDEENIGRAFNLFNELKEKWNAVGEIPREHYSRVQTEFSRLQETFYYNITIYKELADHDKKVNLKEKKELIEKLKELGSEKNVQELDKKVKAIIAKWDSVGATFQQDWESLKDEFWGEARKIFARINEHYDKQRTALAEHLEEKKALIKQVQDIAGKERSKRKEWMNSTEKVLGIQEAWKKIGFSKDNESVWKEFRQACDSFFDAKKAYFDAQSEEYAERRDEKKSLIATAQELASSTDWKKSGEQLIALQKQWKEIGPTFQRDENKLWKEFRGHCDSFFNARNRNFKEREKDEKENLQVKEDIIARIKSFELSDNKSAVFQQLKQFSEEWNGVGHVPFKHKDRVYKEYRAALNEHYDALRLDEKEKKDLLMQQKLDSIKNDPRSMDREKHHIRKQIDKLNQDIRQYENNLGFFNDPSGNNPLVLEVERKIKRNKARINELKQMLKVLSTASA